MTPDLITLAREKLAYQQHTLSPDAEDTDWAYWNGKRDENARTKPITDALLKVAEQFELIAPCDCEAGGGIIDLDPGFICGNCTALAELEKAVRGEV